MDYKAKYDQALERAKRWADGTLQPDRTTPQGVCEAIFPELRESEDERIRKFLIDLLSCGIWKEEWPFSPPECVEYLERQKDSIPYEKYVEDIAAIHAEARTKYHAGWNDGYEAKQKALKCDVREFTIYHPLKNGKGEYECIPYSFYGSLTSFSEDKDLIDFLRACFYTKEECNEWIERQKEPKPETASASSIPSCWEEKHKEQKHDDIIGYATFSDGSTMPIKDRTKERKPKWKPTEAQMNELHGALIPGHGYDCDVLASLYADIKKQMKEDWQ